MTKSLPGVTFNVHAIGTPEGVSTLLFVQTNEHAAQMVEFIEAHGYTFEWEEFAAGVPALIYVKKGSDEWFYTSTEPRLTEATDALISRAFKHITDVDILHVQPLPKPEPNPRNYRVDDMLGGFFPFDTEGQA